jgi:hypothetical protein
MRSARSRNGRRAVDDFFRRTRHAVTDTLLDSAREMGQHLVQRSLKALLLTGVGILLLGFGLVLLLMGGFHALRSIPLSDAAAYAIMGLLALLGGLAACRTARTAGRRKES